MEKVTLSQVQLSTKRVQPEKKNSDRAFMLTMPIRQSPLYTNVSSTEFSLPGFFQRASQGTMTETVETGDYVRSIPGAANQGTRPSLTSPGSSRLLSHHLQ